MSQEEPYPSRLVHAHKCSSCGRFSLPEQLSSRDSVRGLYECPFCHSCEALNVQIVFATEVDGQS